MQVDRVSTPRRALTPGIISLRYLVFTVIAAEMTIRVVNIITQIGLLSDVFVV